MSNVKERKRGYILTGSDVNMYPLISGSRPKTCQRSTHLFHDDESDCGSQEFQTISRYYNP